jgi:hypothetical protein
MILTDPNFIKKSAENALIKGKNTVASEDIKKH